MRFAVSEIKLIPSESSFKIESDLSKRATLSRLKEYVAARHTLFFDAENEFEGEVYESGFEIRQSVGYTYSLLPVFHGQLEETNHIVVIRVKASNTLTVLGVLWGWAWSIGLVYAGMSRLFQHASDSGTAFAFVLHGIFAACITTFVSTFYWRKVRDGKERLISILARGQVNSPRPGGP